MSAQDLVNEWKERIASLKRDYKIASTNESNRIERKIDTYECVVGELQGLIDRKEL